MNLTPKLKNELRNRGYIQLSSIVPAQKRNMALRAINHSISGGIDPDRVAEFRATSYCPELRRSTAITDLLYATPLWGIAESLCGTGKLNVSGGGQIALRFPIMENPGSMHPHIDGMYTATNRLRKGELQSFTMLAGVFLSDVSHEYWGNFTVWPGTHLKIADYAGVHGPQALAERMPAIEMPAPVQLLAGAGDALLCHYLLAHTVVSNVSPYIRYAVFFRISHVDHVRNGVNALTDPWLEWPGMAEDLG